MNQISRILRSWRSEDTLKRWRRRFEIWRISLAKGGGSGWVENVSVDQWSRTQSLEKLHDWRADLSWTRSSLLFVPNRSNNSQVEEGKELPFPVSLSFSLSPLPSPSPSQSGPKQRIQNIAIFFSSLTLPCSPKLVLKKLPVRLESKSDLSCSLSKLCVSFLFHVFRCWKGDYVRCVTQIAQNHKLHTRRPKMIWLRTTYVRWCETGGTTGLETEWKYSSDSLFLWLESFDLIIRLFRARIPNSRGGPSWWAWR